jgi:L-seryl-tRNA(Ser) seleniumtransferase
MLCLRTHELAAAVDRLGADGEGRRPPGPGTTYARVSCARDAVVDVVLADLPRRGHLNAPGAQRAPGCSCTPTWAATPVDAAVQALETAAGTTDVELDLRTGSRGRRGAGALAALAAAVPDAEEVHVVNNGAAALMLLRRRAAWEAVVARGELVEIGDGFRIPELLEAAGVRLREVGTTNRVSLDDYAAALGPETSFVLKIHPSNFVVSGFTSSVDVASLAGLPVPVVADIGSGLLGASPPTDGRAGRGLLPARRRGARHRFGRQAAGRSAVRAAARSRRRWCSGCVVIRWPARCGWTS